MVKRALALPAALVLGFCAPLLGQEAIDTGSPAAPQSQAESPSPATPTLPAPAVSPAPQADNATPTPDTETVVARRALPPTPAVRSNKSALAYLVKNSSPLLQSAASPALLRKLGEADGDIRTKNYSRAEEIIKEVIEQDPTIARAYQLRALIRLDVRDFEGAAEDAQGALNAGLRDPDRARDVEMLNVMARCLVELGKIPEAEEALRRSFELSAPNADAFRVQADVWTQKGEPDRSLAAFKMAADLDPQKYKQEFRKAQAAKALSEAQRHMRPFFIAFWLGLLGFLGMLAARWQGFRGLAKWRAPARTVPAAAPAPAVAWEPGAWLADSCRLEKLLGEGGSGEAYLAFDKNLDRQAVVKRLRAAQIRKEQERLLKEARKAANLEGHPNIARIYQVLNLPNELALVYERVEGETLGRILKRKGRLSFAEAARYLKPVCLALDHIHRRGIFHRNLKPSNVMVSKEGVVKLMDFGVALEFANLPAVEILPPAGALDYVAPEMLKGVACAQSDVYALGTMLYELLSGEPPFAGSIEEKHAHKMKMDFKPLADTVPAIPNLPVGIDEFLAHALRPWPEDRLQTAEQFLAGLEKLAASQAGSHPKSASKAHKDA